MTDKAELLIDELVAACIAFGRLVEPDWQKRIETAQRELREYIDELETKIDIRKDQLREAKNILIDKNLQIDSLYEEGYKLQKRIAELEAESDQLTAHSDIERQDDKWIPEVQE